MFGKGDVAGMIVSGRRTMVIHDYAADKVAELEVVIEDLESCAETPSDYEALARLTELRDKLRIALERIRSEHTLYL